MDRMIYLAMSGAKALMQRQDALATNLANVSTNGFRALMTAARSVPVEGHGASTRAFAVETTPTHSNAHGPIQTTDRPLDVAMRGNAWLAVQALDGTEGYTRAGQMELSGDGTLTMRGGLPVLGDGGPIQIPAGAMVTIGDDGTVSATVSGRSTPIGRLKLVNPEAPLVRGEDGLFRAADQNPLPQDPAGKVQQGALEGSNVSAVETMVAMIAAARQFETQMKILQNAENNERQAARLLGTSL